MRRFVIFAAMALLSLAGFSQGVIHDNGDPRTKVPTPNCATTRFYIDDSTALMYQAAQGSPCLWTPAPIIEAHTAAGVAELDFTTCLSSNPKAARIDLTQVKNATSGTISIQVSANGGATYDTTAGHYAFGRLFAQIVGGTATGNTATTSTGFGLGGNVNAADVNAYNGSLFIYSPGAATVSNWTAAITSWDGTNLFLLENSYQFNQTTGFNAFRVLSTTTFNGTVTCTVIAP